VFVFSASQTGLPIASSNSKSTSAVVPKSTTQDNEFKAQTTNVLNSIPGVNPTPAVNLTSGANHTQALVQDQVHQSRTRRPRFVIKCILSFHMEEIFVIL